MPSVVLLEWCFERGEPDFLDPSMWHAKDSRMVGQDPSGMLVLDLDRAGLILDRGLVLDQQTGPRVWTRDETSPGPGPRGQRVLAN